MTAGAAGARSDIEALSEGELFARIKELVGEDIPPSYHAGEAYDQKVFGYCKQLYCLLCLNIQKELADCAAITRPEQLNSINVRLTSLSDLVKESSAGGYFVINGAKLWKEFLVAQPIKLEDLEARCDLLLPKDTAISALSGLVTSGLSPSPHLPATQPSLVKETDVAEDEGGMPSLGASPSS